MSRWQFRKFAQLKAQQAATCVPSAHLSQVKSLGSADFATNSEVGRGSMAETERVDREVRTTDLGIDIQIPNFLPFLNPFETDDVAVQTATAVPELGGSTSTRARRETQIDRIINEYHRGALYAEQDIRYLEHKYQDEALVEELRETFAEWEMRMQQFQFIATYDSSTQTGCWGGILRPMAMMTPTSELALNNHRLRARGEDLNGVRLKLAFLFGSPPAVPRTTAAKGK